MNKSINIHIVNKAYRSKKRLVEVFRDLKLEIFKGEFVTILGPSGCGKSTLLRIIAGLDNEFDGTVDFGDEALVKSFIFQDLALFPWMTVEENLSFINKDETEIERRLKDVGLMQYRKFWIRELSGGMKQRLAIARGLINNPTLLLLDEPLREIDMITKEYIQTDLKKLLKDGNVTSIMVSHDIEESIFLSDRIVVLSDKPGVIRNIYEINFNADDRTTREYQQMKNLIRKELF